MAAGLGFKTFTTGEVLTAADTNGYLMQGINVFASTAARDAAITSPQEGQFAYTKDTNSLWYYTGSAWAASGATGDIEGVTAGIGISGGGTSGTVTVTNSMATAIDAKGDLIAGTAADTFDRLAVGTNGQTLVADSTASTGLKWATPARSYSLLNAGGTALTGATTITVSGISGMNSLLVQVAGASSANASAYIDIKFNGDATAANYKFAGVDLYSGTNLEINSQSGGRFPIGRTGTSAADALSGGAFIEGCNSSGVKAGWISGGGAGSLSRAEMTYAIYAGTSTISSVSVNSGSGNFDAGTIYVYGAA
jgi:hypothetical protein